MKKLKLCTFLFAAAALLSGCGGRDTKTINIAVTGSPEEYSEYFEQGIKEAYEDVCSEYKDSGFDIKLEFYDDLDNYETGAEITENLVNDSSVTAIIGSSSPDICENQIYNTDKAGKILVCPHWVYDKTMEEGKYDKVFYLNYSGKNTGYVMRKMAEYVSAKKWALCYADDKISVDEIKYFLSSGNTEGAQVVDSVKISTLISDFDRISDRWRLLGVEGVVLIPYDSEGFDILYRLKKTMPQLCVISDNCLDDYEEIKAHLQDFEKVYIVDRFNLNTVPSQIFDDNTLYDTWQVHGYNTFRMIVDTAVENNTDSCEEIAAALHKNGYSGEFENFKFSENGSTVYDEFFCYGINNGYVEEYVVSSDEAEESGLKEISADNVKFNRYSAYLQEAPLQTEQKDTQGQNAQN